MLDVDTAKRDCDDTFKILIATDNHIGYNEKDPIRGEDSFNTFEEILQLANEHEVDFVLLGGDLFDANKPTQYCFQRTVELIKKYSFGSKEVQFEVVDSFNDSNCEETEKETLTEATPKMNFYDPNLNVAIPIFSIHGNHDDPTGMKSVSSLDTLASMGLVNYIGRCDTLNEVQVNPIILYKGKTELALYGVGHLADKRFVRLHREHKVSFNRVNVDTAFQMLVLHQNRANRGSLNYIPFSVIPTFFDLVMWGHEHDCLIEPMVTNNVYFTQPGSSVATSLSDGESIPKKVGILYINQKQFQLEPIQLKTVRPMIYRQLLLDPPTQLDEAEAIEMDFEENSEKEVLSQLNEMLEEVKSMNKKQLEQFGYDNKMLPLLRLVVHYMDPRQNFNHKKLSLMFADRVANPQDIILQKRITERKNVTAAKNNYDYNLSFDEDSVPKEAIYYVQKGMDDAFKEVNVCSAFGLMEAFTRFVQYSDSNALGDYLQFRKDKFMKECEGLINPDDEEETLLEKITQSIANQHVADESDEVRKLFDNPTRVKVSVKVNDESSDMDMSTASNDTMPPPKPTRGKGSRGGRGSRASRAKKT